MMIKVTATALAGVMALGMLTACGGSSDAETTTATADTTASTASADAKKVKGNQRREQAVFVHE